MRHASDVSEHDRSQGLSELASCRLNNHRFGPNGQVLTIAELPNQGIGWQLWDASLELASYLAGHPETVQDLSVVELGSGCGLCGMVAASLGARRVVLTDTAEMIPHLSGNVSRNFSEADHVSCQVLDWTDIPEDHGDDDGSASGLTCRDGVLSLTALGGAAPDVILASDCTYWKHLFVPFHHTLLFLCGPETRLILGHKYRRRDVEAEAFELLSHTFTTNSSRHSADSSIQASVPTLLCGGGDSWRRYLAPCDCHAFRYASLHDALLPCKQFLNFLGYVSIMLRVMYTAYSETCTSQTVWGAWKHCSCSVH